MFNTLMHSFSLLLLMYRCTEKTCCEINDSNHSMKNDLKTTSNPETSIKDVISAALESKTINEEIRSLDKIEPTVEVNENESSQEIEGSLLSLNFTDENEDENSNSSQSGYYYLDEEIHAVESSEESSIEESHISKINEELQEIQNVGALVLDEQTLPDTSTMERIEEEKVFYGSEIKLLETVKENLHQMGQRITCLNVDMKKFQNDKKEGTTKVELRSYFEGLREIHRRAGVEVDNIEYLQDKTVEILFDLYSRVGGQYKQLDDIKLDLSRMKTEIAELKMSGKLFEGVEAIHSVEKPTEIQSSDNIKQEENDEMLEKEAGAVLEHVEDAERKKSSIDNLNQDTDSREQLNDKQEASKNEESPKEIIELDQEFFNVDEMTKELILASSIPQFYQQRFITLTRTSSRFIKRMGFYDFYLSGDSTFKINQNLMDSLQSLLKCLDMFYDDEEMRVEANKFKLIVSDLIKKCLCYKF